MAAEVIDFMFRGLKFHVWEYEDNVYGVPRPMCYAAGRSEDIDGDYEEKISSRDPFLAGYDQ